MSDETKVDETTETSKDEGEETLAGDEGEQDTELSKEDYEKKLAELEAQKDKWKMRFQRNQKKIQTAS